jgi:hypothetical protein
MRSLDACSLQLYSSSSFCPKDLSFAKKDPKDMVEEETRLELRFLPNYRATVRKGQRIP